MKTKILISLLLLLLFSCHTKSPNTKAVNKEINKINKTKDDAEQLLKYFNSTKDSIYLSRAENQIDSLIRRDINDIKLYQIKGNILRIRKRYDEFAKFMNESTSHFPDSPHAFFGAGLAYEKINNIESSKEMFQKSLRLFDQLIVKYPTVENYFNRCLVVCFLDGKQTGLEEFEKIEKSGKFEKASIEAYKGSIVNFDRNKYIKAMFNNP